MSIAQEVELAISAQNTYTDPVLVNERFNFSIVSSSFVGTVTLQRRFNTSDSWRDVNTFVTAFEGWDVQPGGAQYRAGVKTGEYTSGTATVRISDARA
jgi:hypothetical protein